MDKFNLSWFLIYFLVNSVFGKELKPWEFFDSFFINEPFRLYTPIPGLEEYDRDYSKDKFYENNPNFQNDLLIENIYTNTCHIIACKFEGVDALRPWAIVMNQALKKINEYDSQDKRLKEILEFYQNNDLSQMKKEQLREIHNAMMEYLVQCQATNNSSKKLNLMAREYYIRELSEIFGEQFVKNRVYDFEKKFCIAEENCIFLYHTSFYVDLLTKKFQSKFENINKKFNLFSFTDQNLSAYIGNGICKREVGYTKFLVSRDLFLQASGQAEDDQWLKKYMDPCFKKINKVLKIIEENESEVEKLLSELEGYEASLKFWDYAKCLLKTENNSKKCIKDNLFFLIPNLKHERFNEVKLNFESKEKLSFIASNCVLISENVSECIDRGIDSSKKSQYKKKKALNFIKDRLDIKDSEAQELSFCFTSSFDFTYSHDCFRGKIDELIPKILTSKVEETLGELYHPGIFSFIDYPECREELKYVKNQELEKLDLDKVQYLDISEQDAIKFFIEIQSQKNSCLNKVSESKNDLKLILKEFSQKTSLDRNQVLDLAIHCELNLKDSKAVTDCSSTTQLKPWIDLIIEIDDKNKTSRDILEAFDFIAGYCSYIYRHKLDQERGPLFKNCLDEKQREYKKKSSTEDDSYLFNLRLKIVRDHKSFTEEEFVEAIHQSLYPFLDEENHEVKKKRILDFYRTTSFENLPLIKKNNIEEFEIIGIRYYTGSGYQKLNPAMWSGDDFFKLAPIIAVTIEGIEKLPDYKGVVFRKTTLPDDVLSEHQVGDILTYQAFTSASKLNIWSGEHEFHIKSKSGAYLELMTSNKGEEEVLFPPGVKFKITKRDANKIYMEEVP